MLNGPECPPDMIPWWNNYISLAGCRTGNGFGPNPIGWSEIYHWSLLMGIKLTHIEVDILRGLDNLYLKAYAERPQKDGT